MMWRIVLLGHGGKEIAVAHNNADSHFLIPPTVCRWGDKYFVLLQDSGGDTITYQQCDAMILQPEAEGAAA